MRYLKALIAFIAFFLLSFGSTFAQTNTSKNSYFAATDKIYSELYDNKLLSESVWNALLNQSHSLIYSMKVNPKYIHMAALEFGSDILANRSDANSYDIKSLKDGYYSLTKDIYYKLYTAGYINNMEYDSQRNQAWEYIYNANSAPRKIYNSAIEYKKMITKKSQ